MFSPIRRVAYDVEAARVGQRTDYDKLILDVTTNGSIDPKDAIAQAAEILIRQLAIFTDLEKIEGFGEPSAAGSTAAAMVDVSLAHGMENFPIEELELGVRSYNCLKRVGIETIGDLVDEDGERARLDPELRQEVDRGGQGDARASTACGCAAATNGERAGVDRRAPPALRQEARPRLGAPQGALREPHRCADRARAHQDDRHEGEGGQADRRADDHARPARRPARPPPGDGVPALAGRRPQAVRRASAPRFAERPGGYARIVKHRPAPGRRGRDGRTSSSSTRSTSTSQREERATAVAEPSRGREPEAEAASRRPSRPRPRKPRPRPRPKRRPKPSAEEPEPDAEAEPAEAEDESSPGRRAWHALAPPRGRRRRRSRRLPSDEPRAASVAKLVSKNRQRSTARPTSSSADDDRRRHDRGRVVVGIRNGSVCRIPPMNVPTPVIAPRTTGLPRPVSSPVSERPSREGHRDRRADRGREPGDERRVRLVREDRDAEDRRQRRQRAVDQPDHRRLHALEEEMLLDRHDVECIRLVTSR